MNAIEKVIYHCEAARDELLKLSNDPSVYNSYLSEVTESMGWELHRRTEDLKSVQFYYKKAANE
jgi:hypothetical protein